MIERQCGQVVEREPPHAISVVSCRGLHIVGVNLCQICHGYRPAPWISARIAGSVQLLQFGNLDPGLLHQFPPRGVDEAFILIDETSWHCPTSGEWLALPADQKHPRAGLACRDRQIHCQGRSGDIRN